MNRLAFLAVMLTVPSLEALSAEPAVSPWRAALVTDFGTGPAAAVERCRQRFPSAIEELEIIADWLAHDGAGEVAAFAAAVAKVIGEIEAATGPLHRQLNELASAKVPVRDGRWAELYLSACETRRAARLARHRDRLRRVVFTKHYDLGGSHYAYTEGQSDAQAERHFQPGSSLCLFELDGLFPSVRTLIDDPGGVIRDPDVSYDGKRILFAWKKSLDGDDYHLYELEVASGNVRQLTFGLGFADYEGVYLPNGDILFNSTRCVQTVDCWWTEVSNLFTCAGDGRYLRRLTYDQVHTNFPMVTGDGRVLYTRWDYNDRGQIYPQGLFQMNPDGTTQEEFYGNNSYFPTTILHARSIPGSPKVVAVFSGHHTHQQGWLGTIDPTKGRQENSGARLIAPRRPTEAVRVDRYGQSGEQFQYPYPLSEKEFLVTFRPAGAKRFALYWMDEDGRRELLVSDPKISCNQPVPLAARPRPPIRKSLVDYRQDTATVYVHDVYAGEGLQGVARGTIKTLRVVALDFRAAGVGCNYNRGPAGGALISTPVSIEGTWDVKIILGDAPVYEDGSAAFTVPAKTPLYYQALDAEGCAVQTMRSWTTLQPGERSSCVGCHDYANTAPPSGRLTRALAAGPQPLEPFHGPPRGFSFRKEIQPILDRHCVACHYADEQHPAKDAKAAFSLKGTMRYDEKALRSWSDAYRALANRKYVAWINVQEGPPMLPPYHAGAAKSPLLKLLKAGHYDVQLARADIERLAAWIDLLIPHSGDYREGMEGAPLARYQHFFDKRLRWQRIEAQNILELVRDRY